MSYACLLCGHTDAEVRMGLVRWADPAENGRVFDAIPRCTDRIACRARVEDENHEPWPLVDASRATWDAKPQPLAERKPPAETDVPWLS